MSDDQDREITRLRGEIAELSQRRPSGAASATLRVLAVLAALAVVTFGCMAALGSRIPAGEEFAAVCRGVAPPSQVEACMADLDQNYRGPDIEQNRRNAAAQWAADRPWLYQN